MADIQKVCDRIVIQTPVLNRLKRIYVQKQNKMANKDILHFFDMFGYFMERWTKPCVPGSAIMLEEIISVRHVCVENRTIRFQRL